MKRIHVLIILVLIAGSLFNVAAETVDANAAVLPAASETEIAGEHTLPSPYMVIPFVVLLLMIATGPLFYHHFWEHNYPKVSIFLGLITTVYYLTVLNDTHSLMHTLAEYLSFIALLSSLFFAAGGIFINVDRKSTPMLNVILLFFGSIIANIIGTTGASMLLIRPFIKINKNRIKPYHIIFFIFLVSNIGGALTPLVIHLYFLDFLGVSNSFGLSQMFGIYGFRLYWLF